LSPHDASLNPDEISPGSESSAVVAVPGSVVTVGFEPATTSAGSSASVSEGELLHPALITTTVKIKVEAMARPRTVDELW
jgi:hypothetical protein